MTGLPEQTKGDNGLDQPAQKCGNAHAVGVP